MQLTSGRRRILRRSRSHRVRHGSDERGVALVAAVGVSFVVVVLSATALSQSISSVTLSGIGQKQETSTEAAEAGLQTMIASLGSAVDSGSVTCASDSALATTGGTTSGTAIVGPVTSFALAYAVLPGQQSITAYGPSVTYAAGQSVTYNGYLYQATADSTGQAPPPVAASGTASQTTPDPAASNEYWTQVVLDACGANTTVTLQPGSTYFVESTGNTTSMLVGARTLATSVFVPCGGQTPSCTPGPPVVNAITPVANPPGAT